MKYMIMSNGKGTRWNNYLGITKQEIVINGERLIDRTIRMISERTNDNIYILSKNPNHNNELAERIMSKYDDYFHRKYAYDYLDEPITYLYGDVFYEDKTMDLIVFDECKNIHFYGNENAIIAIKVVNYELLKNVIDNIDCDIKSLYHAFDNCEEYRSFISVGNGFVNINTPSDYIDLINNKKILLKR